MEDEHTIYGHWTTSPPVTEMGSFRSVLEVLKFLPPTSLPSICSLSHTWLAASTTDELWLSYLFDYGFSPSADPLSPKQSFISQFPRRTQVALITATQILAFDCKRQAWLPAVSLSPRARLSHETAGGFLPDGSVILCGGMEWKTQRAMAEVSQIAENGSVCRLESLHTARGGVGLLVYRGVVYTFGGYDGGRVNVCEKMGVERPEWRWRDGERMGKGRAWVNPCVVTGKVWLVGGDDEVTAETFDPETDLYSPAPLHLTPISECISLSTESRELLVLQNRTVTLYRGAKVTSRMENRDLDLTWSCFTPCLVDFRVFSVSSENSAIQRIDTTHGSLDQLEAGESEFSPVYRD